VFDEKSDKSKINGKAIEADKTYKIAMPDFLMTGLESNLDFLTPNNPAILAVSKVDDEGNKRDAHLSVIRFLEEREK